MPSRFRSRRPRRRRRGGRRRTRHGMTARGLALKALAHIDTSVKYLDFQPGNVQPFLGTSVAIVLNAMLEGTDHNQRIGEAVKMRSIQVRMLVTQAVAENVLVRMLLVYDTQPQGGAPAILATILEDDQAQNSLISPRNLNSNRRFKVLWHHDTYLDPNSRNQRIVKFFVPLMKMTRYSDGTGQNQAITQGALSIYFMSTGSQANRTNIESFFRLRYVG